MIEVASQQLRRPAHLFARLRWKWSLAWLPHRDRRLHTHYILQTEFRYARPELAIDPITGISDDYSTRDVLSHCIPDLIQRDLRLGLEFHIFGTPAALLRFLSLAHTSGRYN